MGQKRAERRGPSILLHLSLSIVGLAVVAAARETGPEGVPTFFDPKFHDTRKHDGFDSEAVESVQQNAVISPIEGFSLSPTGNNDGRKGDKDTNSRHASTMFEKGTMQEYHDVVPGDENIDILESENVPVSEIRITTELPPPPQSLSNDQGPVYEVVGEGGEPTGDLVEAVYAPEGWEPEVSDPDNTGNSAQLASITNTVPALQASSNRIKWPNDANQNQPSAVEGQNSAPSEPQINEYFEPALGNIGVLQQQPLQLQPIPIPIPIAAAPTQSHHQQYHIGQGFKGYQFHISAPQAKFINSIGSYVTSMSSMIRDLPKTMRVPHIPVTLRFPVPRLPKLIARVPSPPSSPPTIPYTFNIPGPSISPIPVIRYQPQPGPFIIRQPNVDVSPSLSYGTQEQSQVTGISGQQLQYKVNPTPGYSPGLLPPASTNFEDGETIRVQPLPAPQVAYGPPSHTEGRPIQSSRPPSVMQLSQFLSEGDIELGGGIGEDMPITYSISTETNDELLNSSMDYGITASSEPNGRKPLKSYYVSAEAFNALLNDEEDVGNLGPVQISPLSSPPQVHETERPRIKSVKGSVFGTTRNRRPYGSMKEPGSVSDEFLYDTSSSYGTPDDLKMPSSVGYYRTKQGGWARIPYQKKPPGYSYKYTTTQHIPNPQHDPLLRDIIEEEEEEEHDTRTVEKLRDILRLADTVDLTRSRKNVIKTIFRKAMIKNMMEEAVKAKRRKKIPRPPKSRRNKGRRPRRCRQTRRRPRLCLNRRSLNN